MLKRLLLAIRFRLHEMELCTLTAEQYQAIYRYWHAKDAEAERKAYARLRELGFPAGY